MVHWPTSYAKIRLMCWLIFRAHSRLTAVGVCTQTRPGATVLARVFRHHGAGLRRCGFVRSTSRPAGTEDQFVENVVHLEGGRFCYQPVPWAPEVATLPSLKSGHITFGSFNNTGKLNADVYDVWANVLQAVPDSQLILKWRTLIDPSLCQTIRQAFHDRGIDANRIELRPASFHVDVLKEYADIDIALDPFPFTGGLTSCEALWMGVPVVTLPQTRVVSRQTLALLSAMGKTEWVAKDADDYVSIARTLAADRSGLANIRASLRSTMQASSLMDVTQFTRALESAFCKVHQTVSGNELPLSK